MTGVAIVASPEDAQFAESVRAGLAAEGHDASVSATLPGSSTHVVLLWSAALDATHAIDPQVLIGLWSENRLTVVRRDETPLPLGLRDLASLKQGTTAAEIRASVGETRRGSGAVLLSKPEEFSIGSADLPGAVVEKKSSLIPVFLAFMAVAGFAFGSWYYYTSSERARSSSLMAALEAAAKATEELKLAQMKQLDTLKALEEAQAVEKSTRDAGEVKRAREAVRRAQEAADAQAKVVRQLEEAAAKARNDAKRSADVSRKAAAKAEVASAPKAEVPRVAAAEPKAAPVAKAAPKAQVPARVAREPETKAAASAAPAATAATQEHQTLYEQALAMENEGKGADAIRIYRRAARAGSGKAAKRLGEIFDKGAPGVSRDYAESLQWYETARQLGEPIPIARSRGGSGGIAPTPEVAKSEPVSKSPPPEPVDAKAPQHSSAEPKAAPPPPLPESDSTIGIGTILALALLALAVGFYIWRRRRSAATPVAPTRAARPAQPGAKMLFVSYSHKDKKRIEPIVSLMESMGREVWVDRTAITGQTGWAGQIVRAIRECRAVVLMASPNSYASDQVVRELYLAMNHKKTIVPIEIEPAELPDELQYILAPFQHHRLSGGETRDVLGRALAAV